MNDRFDELAKGLAQSVTRRGALKKFSVSLAAVALASLGLPNQAKCAGPGGCKPSGKVCHRDNECCSGFCVYDPMPIRLKGYCL
jgi:hypothetical protein